MKHGDFSALAEEYSKYRPHYSKKVLNLILDSIGKPVRNIKFADLGAGTGIWTRMVVDGGVQRSVAVEPDDNMRLFGVRDSNQYGIEWRKGTGEETGLETDTYDLVTMASSFHWVDFRGGTQEIARILKPNGCFAAIWNPRCVEANPFTLMVEKFLYDLVPNLKRVSSGNCNFANTLGKRLTESSLFGDVIYLEDSHIVQQSPETYLGIWKSVNDVRVQAGEEKFHQFLTHVEKELDTMSVVEAHYRTRAWCARAI